MDSPLKTTLDVAAIGVSAAVLAHQIKMDIEAKKHAKKISKALKKQAKKSEEIRIAANAVKQKVLEAHKAGVEQERTRRRSK